MLTTPSAETNPQPKHFHFKAHPKIINKKHTQSQASSTTQHSSPCQSAYKLANPQAKHFHFKAHSKIIKKKHTQSQTSTTTQHASPCQSAFKLATWNCSGIRDKEDRLLRWMSRESVDVCCITETWLVDATAYRS